ncbi:MAG: Fic family protein [Saprospiraceae bacterium]|nr:Fic family protein [Pyrinomonadaceae bacterium]
MTIADRHYFDKFNFLIGGELRELVDRFDFTGQNGDLNYQTQASAVYSSNIEGNSIDLNSFMNSRIANVKFEPQKELREIEDLVSAYEFAQKEPLTEVNLLKAHYLFSEQFVIKELRGIYRNEKVGVFGQSGLVYLAVEPEYVAAEMKGFFEEISKLLSTKLSLEETFYFASLIHLRFAHIHPFSDGNGRAARLLEKWFLAEQLGLEFWKIPAEKYYKEHQAEYYANIKLGVNFYELNYDKSLPFLTMLPNSLRNA